MIANEALTRELTDGCHNVGKCSIGVLFNCGRCPDTGGSGGQNVMQFTLVPGVGATDIGEMQGWRLE